MNRGDKLIIEEVASQAATIGYSRLDDMFLLAQEVYKHELDWDDWQQAFAEALIRECRRLTPRRATWERFVPKTWRKGKSTKFDSVSKESNGTTVNQSWFI